MNEKFVYLIKVEKDENNNKFYRMTANETTFLAEWGRIGSKGQSKMFPINQWNTKLRGQLRKGYEDKTENVAEEIKVKAGIVYKEISDTSIAKIVKRLQDMARDAISKNYTVTADKVTQNMIDEADDLINQLMKINDVDKFNDVLIELFKTIPRKMSNVKNSLLQDKIDIPKFIQEEEDLLDVMKGQIAIKKIEEEDGGEVLDKTVLEVMGLMIETVTDEDATKIKEELGSISSRYINAWRVINIKTQEVFDKHIKENKIHEGNKKLLWHGSRNENWWSILRAGLALRPSAVVTGKMFGYGIYFANNPQKSMGYTTGGFWTRSSSSGSVFMSLFDTAYGVPYDVHSFEHVYQSFDYDKLQKAKEGADCLHAHAGRMLRNDEIIYYQEKQMTIKYLVELK